MAVNTVGRFQEHFSQRLSADSPKRGNEKVRSASIEKTQFGYLWNKTLCFFVTRNSKTS